MKIAETTLPGVKIIEPQVRGDERGFFEETYHEKRYRMFGIRNAFVQDNVSFSKRGVLRGLHFQNPNAQGKLVHALTGEIFDVAVDIRRGSPNFGNWVGVTLSGENKKQLWIPPGFAHGFLVKSKDALFAYKCTAYYSPENEGAILWNDPIIGIEWPMTGVRLSKKDRAASRLDQFEPEKLPVFES